MNRYVRNYFVAIGIRSVFEFANAKFDPRSKHYQIQMATVNPTHICPDGQKEWRQNGVLHRDDDYPAIITADGSMFYFQYGQLHRDHDRPAIIKANGDLFWCAYNRVSRNPKLGPAFKLANGQTGYSVDGYELDDVTHERKSNDHFWVFVNGSFKYCSTDHTD